MNIAESIRNANRSALAEFVDHRFFTKAAEGLLTDIERDAYFHFEHRFVEQAVTIFGHILLKAPDIEARRHLVGILYGLTHEQTDVFSRILARIGPPPSMPWPGAVDEFCEGMTAIACHGGYHEGLAAMLAAEWTYAKVSRRLVAGRLDDPLLQDWFALHIDERFLRGVTWIDSELDKAIQNAEQFEQASTAFARAVNLEVAFHSAALDMHCADESLCGKN